MDLESAKDQFRETWNRLREQLYEQEWFQELQSKWQALDPQKQDALRLGAVVGGVLLVGGFFLNIVLSVYSIEDEVQEKRRLLTSIANAQLEMSDTGVAAIGSGADAKVVWQDIIQAAAGKAGMQQPDLKVSPERKGNEDDSTREVLMDIELKHINVIQAYQFAYHLEHADQAMKIRNLTITTDGPDGYLNTQYAISGFEMK